MIFSVLPLLTIFSVTYMLFCISQIPEVRFSFATDFHIQSFYLTETEFQLTSTSHGFTSQWEKCYCNRRKPGNRTCNCKIVGTGRRTTFYNGKEQRLTGKS